MTTIHRYFIRQLTIASAIVTLAVCVPVVLIAITLQVPPSLLYSNFVWPILYGTVPTAVYLMLPFAVALAITWTYGTMFADFTHVILYSARMSTISLLSPAIVVAGMAAAVDLSLSCVVAPHSVGQMHDVVHKIRHNLIPSLLEPHRFYVTDDERTKFRFERWAGDNHIENVFVWHKSPENELEYRTIMAKNGTFIESKQMTVLALTNGSFQIHKPNSQTSMDFDAIAQNITLGGTSQRLRNWTGMFELGTLELLNELENIKSDRAAVSRWASEALKRFGVPLLALSHTLLGLGLVMYWGRAPRRERLPDAIYLLLIGAHGAYIGGAEGLIHFDLRISWLVAAFIPLEAASGIFLIARNATGGARHLHSKARIPPDRGTSAVPGRSVVTRHSSHLSASIEYVAEDRSRTEPVAPLIHGLVLRRSRA